MDLISYSAANKAAKSEKETRVDVLGVGVEGNHPHVKSRIDSLERYALSATEMADRLIINDALNLMKAHAKLNTVMKTTRFNMHQLIFEDFLDSSGINIEKSTNCETLNGTLRPAGNSSQYTFVSVTENTIKQVEKAVLVVEESNATNKVSYSITRDNGDTWHPIIPEELFYFPINSPSGTTLAIKIEAKERVNINHYGLTWA